MKDRYLSALLLQAGDVLLSRSPAKASNFISKATRGPYSHAAIYLGDYQLFEARTDGVGLSSLNPCRIEVGSGGIPKVLCSTEEYSDIAVFRCPQKFRTSQCQKDGHLRLQLFSLLAGLNGTEYKKLEGFKSIKSRYDWIPERVRGAILKMAGNIFLRDNQKILTEEFFCSELVVDVLTKCGMSVFKTVKCPSEISPNDLANREISNLEPVNDAICQQDSTSPNFPDYVLQNEKIRAFNVHNKKIVKITKELQTISEKALNELRQSRIDRQQRRNKQVKSSMISKRIK